jgi:hypothetical protein
MFMKGEYYESDWWPVEPKLVFDQMAAPVPGVMDVSLYVMILSTRP